MHLVVLLLALTDRDEHKHFVQLNSNVSVLEGIDLKEK